MRSGLLLLVAAALALALANSRLGPAYLGLWQHQWVLFDARGAAWLDVRLTPGWFVADVLMPVFFFFVGLELRGELTRGVLSEPRRAALPVAAALGGMLAPALIYLSVAGAAQTRIGWGVPVATDIAFALGVLALLGKRVPRELRVLLLALAVIDDLGAIVVIAVFYSRGVSLGWLAFGALGVASAIWLQLGPIRSRLAYLLCALASWLGCLAGGVHPTIAGVALGLAVMDRAPVNSMNPSQRLAATLKPWVELLILPIFALANAGVVLAQVPLSGEPLSVALGVGLGLLLGKPVGVLAATWLVVKTGFARLPDGLGMSQLSLLGCVAGVGFTMSLFIAQLAFNTPALENAAKLGIVVGSAAAGLVGWCLGYAILRQPGE